MRSRSILVLNEKPVDTTEGMVVYSMDSFEPPRSVALLGQRGNGLMAVIGCVDNFLKTSDGRLTGSMSFHHDRDSQEFSKLWDDESKTPVIQTQCSVAKRAFVTDRKSEKRLGQIAVDWDLHSVRLTFP